MPVRDRYHQSVKNALIKDGWTITDDPLHLKWGKRDMYVDLGAEKLIAAQKEGQCIAVAGFSLPSDSKEQKRFIV